MPIYEYECNDCMKRFEKIQALKDPLVTVCPFCGGAVHKCFSVPALQFKGSGFYITDYSKKRPSSMASSETTGKNKSVDSKQVASSKEGGSKS